ncbi:MAG: hypothetical protein JW969_21160 [Spirochaetales bacterium]|nr:hypothetical protein [Spirochaetales bacterium]
MKRRKKTIKETDLYEPLKQFLENSGYSVHAEVHNCDVTAVKDGEVIIIELKTAFSLKLVYQALNRQQIGDAVYVALPRPDSSLRRSPWKDMFRLLKRLEIGLILLDMQDKSVPVEILFHPVQSHKRKSKKKKRALLKEIAGRSVNYNKGGSTKSKLMTAYRENSLFIAVALDHFGPLSPKQLRALGTGFKTQSILYNNFYDWFMKIDKGIYDISPKGKSGIKKYAQLAKLYRRKLKSPRK